MSTLTTINGSDAISTSRTTINNNLAALNTDKMETSVLDTDTTLAANSDAKVATQKAVKAYVDAGGNVNASETAKGIVELATLAELEAGTATGATGAALVVTPDIIGSSLGSSKKSMTAGATINGATLPVPVYQNKTDNQFYACDANDTAAMKFLGFAITNGVDNGSLTVQFSGIVSGFTALDEGEKYYVQDAVGTIGTSIGTYEVLVGVAISETELLIQKGKRHSCGTINMGAVTSDNTLTVGFRPSIVRIVAVAGDSAAATICTNHIVWTNGSQNTLRYRMASGGGTSVDTTNRLDDENNLGTDYFTITITSVTDTTFNITCTKSGGTFGSTAVLRWEAEGEL